jgi:O-antigen/teichoic acid export membrane protein
MIRARQLAGASVGIGAVTVWLALLGLVTTPFLIHRLGVSRYGVFALITIMGAYLSNLEFGFGQATTAFLARAHATRDTATERAVIGTSFCVFLAGGVLAMTVALVGAPWIVRTFVHVPAPFHDEAVDAVRLGALIVFASFLSSFFSSALRALARLRVVIASRAVLGTGASVSAVAVVALGGGLRPVLVALAGVSMAMAGVLGLALAMLTTGSLRPRLHISTLRAMAGFGALVLVAGLAYQAMLQGPPTVLAAHASTRQVAAYSVPNLVLGQLAVLASATSLAFFPFASAASASADRGRLAAVYRSNLRLTLLVMGPVAAYLAIFAHPLLATWIDPGFASMAAGPLRFLAGAALMLALSSPPADVARGLERPAWVTAFTASAAIVAIGVAFVAVTTHGAAGVAFALFAGLCVATIPFIFIVGARLLELRVDGLLASLITPVLAVTGVAAIDALAAAISSGFVAGAVSTSIYGLAVFRLVLYERERAALQRRPWSRSRESTGPGHPDAVYPPSHPLKQT